MPFHSVHQRFAALAVSSFIALPAFGQADPEPKDGKVTIKMTLHPTASPVPLSKLSLYPDYSELIPGTRVQGLLKVFMEQDNFFRMVGNEEWQKTIDLPLAEFPSNAREKYSVGSGIAYDTKYTRFLGYLDKGARFKTIEWNEYFDIRHDGFNWLLPEVQKIRALAMVARMRMRAEVKAGEFAKAAITVKTMMGMAQALEQHPCLIGHLVGVAIAMQAVHGLEEMIQQPGCPNLFWALSDMPQPLLSLRMAVGGERLFVQSQFHEYLRTDRVLSNKEINTFLEDINEMLKLEDQRGGVVDGLFKSAKLRFALLAADTERMAKARKRMIDEGSPADIVKAMPDLQVAILDDFRLYEIRRDDFFKAYHMPYSIAAPILKKSEEQIGDAKRKGEIMGPAFLPAVWKVKTAQARIDQRIALLRVAEAIRLYAHENGGKLPGSLVEIPLPLPVDQYTGKPFEYEVKDGVATVHGSNALKMERDFRHYEITIKK